MSGDVSGSDWEVQWRAREESLVRLLGKSHDHLFHAVVPFHLGGSADVMAFPSFLRGWVFVTAELIGDSGQPENSMGMYELAICTRELEDWAPNLISRLARYTLEATLDPGETMDIGSALPAGSAVSAFLFTELDPASASFRVRGQKCGLLLCLGITKSELEYAWSAGADALVGKLRAAGVFPFTELQRASVA